VNEVSGCIGRWLGVVVVVEICTRSLAKATRVRESAAVREGVVGGSVIGGVPGGAAVVLEAAVDDEEALVAVGSLVDASLGPGCVETTGVTVCAYASMLDALEG